ncbi:MAG: DUF447 family protein [Promethearchaeota archaeon]|nr:MAG: DUF447 family protein [Candidatus Lokiarchaeota archaeon]
MEVQYQDLGIKDGYLYEIIATTISFKNDKKIPNASCMGIRITNNKVIIKPYHNTQTYKNLKDNSLICINFVKEISLYTLAALKGPYLSKKYERFPQKYYEYYHIKNNNNSLKTLKINQIPYLRDAWAIIICRTKKSIKIDKEDVFGPVNLTEFELEMLSIVKLKDSFKLFNRAENLTLETLILTTRLKIAFEKNDYDLVKDYQSKIDNGIKEIIHFNNNLEVSKSINLIQEYIRNLKLEF